MEGAPTLAAPPPRPERHPDTSPDTTATVTPAQSEPAPATTVEPTVAEQIDAYADEVVARMPELTTEQRERLRRLLNPPYRHDPSHK
ncbi:hypothetical protein [Nocardiopsis nanhaiensis]